MKSLKRGLIYFLLIQVCFFNGRINAQEIVLSDWDIIDPWEESCLNTDLNNAEGKLYTNIASKAFTWLTGTKEQAEYEPIGELANYFGFAKLRNEIRDSSDNPLADENLRGSSWLVVLEQLNSDQRQIFYNTAIAQELDFSAFLEERVDLINILYGLKEDKEIVLTDAIYHIEAMSTHEANISIISAKGFGEVSLSLDTQQKDFLTNIRGGNLIVSELVGSGPYTQDVEVEIEQFTNFQKELLKETVSKFLSYETGSLEDAIFLPSGKIGNFFGFAQYRYEERAIVNRSQAADLLFSVLTEEQEDILKCLTKEVYNFEQSYIDSRAKLITDIYPLKFDMTVDENLAAQDYVYGAMDEGRMGVVQAIYFDFLERLLTEDQIEELKILRENTGGETTSTYNQAEPIVEVSFSPNPFKNNTNITYNLIQSGFVELRIYNLQGKLMAELINGQSNSGNHVVNWNTTELLAGSYFYAFKFRKDKSMVIQNSGVIHKL